MDGSLSSSVKTISRGRSLGGLAEVTRSHIWVYSGQAEVINFAWAIDKSEATHF